MPKMDADLLKGLIAPIFMPILTVITSLLDQFSLVILSPIDCVIDHINSQIHKLHLEIDPKNPLQEMSNGLATLNKAIVDGKKKVQDKLEFYIGQAKKLLEEEAIENGKLLEISLKKLNYIRLIIFIVAIILALSRGELSCTKQGQSPKQAEIDSFFANFLNPNLPYTFRTDSEGNLTIDETDPDFNDAYIGVGDLVEIDGEDLSQLPSSITKKIIELQSALVSPIQTVVPCKLQTTPGESAKIDRWIKELSQTGSPTS
jgi:hypothetical protein